VDTSEASAKFKTDRELLEKTFRRHRRKARVVFRKDPVMLQRLAIGNDVPVINRRSESATPVGAADSDPLIHNTNQNWHHPGSADSDPLIHNLRKEYYALRKRYIKAYDDLLDAERNPKTDLSKPENLEILIDALKFWNGKKLKNHAFCIMPNHIHWVFQVFEKDGNGEPVYLQDLLYSVKRFSAGQINKLENREGRLWQKESFDTTIRDEKHLYYAIEYTLNNPVNAGLVNHWREWPGNWYEE
jgi:REP element-mobilizing transposase RayT